MLWRAFWTLVVASALVVASGVYGGRMTLAPFPPLNATSTPPSVCATTIPIPRGHTLDARHVLVNVFNSGSTPGLAESTLARLLSRGFIEGSALNAPAQFHTRAVMILAPQGPSPATRLVAAQFHDQVTFRRSPLILPGVDVIIGDQLSPLRRRARTAIRHLARPATGCLQ